MRTDARQRGRRQWRRGTAGALRSEALVEEAAAPACVLDRHGRILVANRPLEALLGVGTVGSPSWYCHGYGFERLHEASEAVTYELGEGLPGLAWAKGQPMALDDIRDSGRFDRAIPAQRPASARPWPCL